MIDLDAQMKTFTAAELGINRNKADPLRIEREEKKLWLSGVWFSINFTAYFSAILSYLVFAGGIRTDTFRLNK